MMTSKERVRNALMHKPVDRVPAAFGCVGNVYDTLLEHFNFTDGSKIHERFEIDIKSAGAKLLKEFPKRTNEKGNLVTTDYWGFEEEWHIFGKERYSTVCTFPLNNVQSIEEVDNYAWPKTEWFDYSTVTEQCNKFKDKAIIVGHEGAFQQVTHLISMENFFMLMVDEPEIAHRILDRIVDFEIEHYTKILEAGQGMIDILRTHDDYGTQISTLFSIDMWREFFPKNIKRLTSLAHKYNAFFQQHSCGAVAPIIEDLIECGVDSLEPIQPTPGLYPEELIEKYKGRICFQGGIDTQDLLPNKTPAEVKAEAERYVKTLNVDGGYILAPSQGFESDVPVENIVAMYDIDRTTK